MWWRTSPSALDGGSSRTILAGSRRRDPRHGRGRGPAVAVVGTPGAGDAPGAVARTTLGDGGGPAGRRGRLDRREDQRRSRCRPVPVDSLPSRWAGRPLATPLRGDERGRPPARRAGPPPQASTTTGRSGSSTRRAASPRAAAPSSPILVASRSPARCRRTASLLSPSTSDRTARWSSARPHPFSLPRAVRWESVLIEIDPTRSVYLMLTTEPAPTRSGETLPRGEGGRQPGLPLPAAARKGEAAARALAARAARARDDRRALGNRGLRRVRRLSGCESSRRHSTPPQRALGDRDEDRRGRGLRGL